MQLLLPLLEVPLALTGGRPDHVWGNSVLEWLGMHKLYGKIQC